MAVFANFTGQSYQADSLLADAQSAMNCFLEGVESKEGQNTAYLRLTPGLTLSVTLPTTPVRGIWIGEQSIYAVGGQFLYQLLQQTGTVTTNGTAVTWVSGSKFDNTHGAAGNTIWINGVQYTVSTYNSSTSITLTGSAGVQAVAVAFVCMTYVQISSQGIGNDGLPVQMLQNGNQLMLISAGQTWMALGPTTIVPALFPNRFGNVSVDATGLIVTWVSGTTFDSTMVGKLIYINTVPYGVATVTIPVSGVATVLGLSSAAPTTASAPYQMTLPVIGYASAIGTAVTWQSGPGIGGTTGPEFDSSMAGNTIVLGANTFTVAAFVDATHLTLATSAGTTGTVAFSTSVPVYASQGAYLDGVFIVCAPNSSKMNSSNILDGTTWNLLNFASKQSWPDNINALLADHETLNVFGTTYETEAWQTNPASSAFALQRDPGQVMLHGSVAPFAPVSLGEGIAWLAGTRNGWTVAYRATGFLPGRISTHAIEKAWASYPTTSDAVSYVYIDEGHEFWVINFPSGNATWVYDATAGAWHQRGWWNGASWDRQRQMFHGFVFGNHYVGDWQNGNIYIQSTNAATDNGTVIMRQRAAPHLNTEHLWSFYNYFELLTDAPAGTVFILDWSDDGAQTWHAGLSTSPNGIAGQATRVIWRRLGRSRDRIWRITFSTAGKGALVTAYLGVEQGNS